MSNMVFNQFNGDDCFLTFFNSVKNNILILINIIKLNLLITSSI